MRLLVCGGRAFHDKEFVEKQLEPFTNIEVLIHGDATGVDTLAKEWAKKHQIPILTFPAQWKLYGRKAGPLRNKQMLEKGKPTYGIAIEGGIGTQNMVSLLKKANIPVIEIRK